MYGVVSTLVTLLRIISQSMADARVCDFDSCSVRCGFFLPTRERAASMTHVNRFWLIMPIE
jgi:hypothetical protein